MYIHKEYPKFVYHKSEKPKIVNSEEEQKELGKEWKEIPFDAETAKEEAETAKDKPKKKAKEESNAE